MSEICIQISDTFRISFRGARHSRQASSAARELMEAHTVPGDAFGMAAERKVQTVDVYHQLTGPDKRQGRFHDHAHSSTASAPCLGRIQRLGRGLPRRRGIR